MLRFLTPLMIALALHADAAQDGYRLPPPEVVALADAPVAPRVMFSPDERWMLHVERDTMPTLADLSRPMLRLAGLRIDPAADGPHNSSYSNGLVLQEVGGESETRVPLPEGARLDVVSWSHSSDRFAFTLVSKEATELWTATLSTAASPRRVVERLNSVLGGFEWAPDGRSILCRVVPAERGAAPERPEVPAAPAIRVADGDASPLRTFQDLLTDEHDAALFEHHGRSQLMLVSESGEQEPVGEPGLIRGATFSPDGRHVLVTRIQRPFSYAMAYWQFPHTIEVVGLDGRLEYLVARVPLAEGIPLHGVRLGPRSVDWAAAAPAELVWIEALDGGDPKVEVPHRDRWVTLSAPFEGEPRELLRIEHRARGLSYLGDGRHVLSSEYDRDRRWTRVTLHDLAEGGVAPRVVEDRSTLDRYGDPGRVVMESSPSGARIVRQDGPWIYRTGRGDSPAGPHPFLDRQDLETLEIERLWQSTDGTYESVAAVLAATDDELPRVITRYESPELPPNYRLRDLAADRAQALTAFPDPTPQLRGIHKEVVQYQRSDGVQLSATLYLPADYVEGTRLPLIVWAYPREFNDPKTAGQVTATPDRFTRIAGTSHLNLLTQGYAIMDGATMPIIGDPETMNDTFIAQLVDAAAAAIDYAVERGVADRNRVGVGGHSYGAFMTANLLAHSNLFHAGVARSGAYNRTLTPFGFQAERRTFWEAPEIYFALSPFMHADKIDEPLLLVHGERDNNSGTFPIQSERLFQAIQGNGGTARLVMLPMESHGYRARESVLHTLAEMIDWFEVHLSAERAVEANSAASGADSGR